MDVDANVHANVNTNADAWGSTIALRERCSGELKMTFVPSEESDQPGHPPSLIRDFAVRMKKHWVLSYPLSALWRLIRLGGCPGPGWSESSLGAQIILLAQFIFLRSHLSYLSFLSPPLSGEMARHDHNMVDWAIKLSWNILGAQEKIFLMQELEFVSSFCY